MGVKEYDSDRSPKYDWKTYTRIKTAELNTWLVDVVSPLRFNIVCSSVSVCVLLQ